MTAGLPSSSPARRAAPGWVPWVATPLVALLLGASLDAVDQVAPYPLGGPSARFAPEDGQRTVARDLLGAETVSEHTRSVGIEGAFSAPMTVTAAVASRLGEDELRRAQWWRASRVGEGGERAADLYRLTNEGIVQVASWGGGIGFVFEPELVVVPAFARPGDAWNGSGSALAGGLLTYSADSVAVAVTEPPLAADGREIPISEGCIGIDSTLRIGSTADDLSTTLVESTVWCPGRGAVWSSGTVDGQPIGQAEVQIDALTADAGPAPSAVPWTSAALSSPSLGPGRSLPLTIIDPFFGTTVESGQYAVAPGSTADGRLVTANDRGDDLQVWRLEGSEAVLDWFGHPGGTIVAVGSAGGLVAATTSNREVVAYDTTGRRLWAWTADELVLASPLGVGGTGGSGTGPPGLLIVARSGTVTLLDAVTGRPRWSSSIGADARSQPAQADGLVLVADERDRLTALDAQTGVIRWQREAGPIDLLAAEGEAGAVVAMLDTGELSVHELADGAVRFTASYRGLARGLLIESGRIITVSDERTVALHAADGAEEWRAPGGSALVGDGSLVAIVGPAEIQVRATSDGALLDDGVIEAGLVSSSRRALAIGAAVVLLDSDGALQRWELR